jgi:uncharacterized protein affecting Mg2+/Co2+ transport
VSDTTTRGVRIQVKSAYLPDRSSPEEGRYFFAYRIRISNVGDETVQLISREWIITDSDGDVETVRGPGVVGGDGAHDDVRGARFHVPSSGATARRGHSAPGGGEGSGFPGFP